ncbi:glutamine--fructose-6-phosphate transaminase (isomerizing) [Gimesia sp.]|uniref:glutamine--fructose-6-phosphate transaminase (isomerizing) n=1 Tax=Gimesia sp. TaxID=2024833 RepID=UPI000C56C7CC|nr:glutamine--fructose-6-phosphate transaminase (isomerizing) [Gimesia sp.]MAX38305.1 glutamine--fructose-6-phosphate transaminase (isomerizing) [Gimesia sp.]HBL45015.1 glutamine--fructose-6-phosphate transaminase (isomerizing) [Planctomycetaceae bacterium]|tara:strand:- start:11312 stop:13174 length:1863 start_codon:yes stop_codon:yes gene_type:complete
MCGIVGYIGHRQAGPILIKGLQKLEYRGYDSAGVAVHDGSAIQIRKKKGRVLEMASLYKSNPVSGTAGIGHTRWATHGETNDQNSHPHVGGNDDVVIVHNGVIENYTSLRKQLQGLGYVFRTTTDTESVAHLLSHHLEEQIKFGSDPEELATYLKAVEITLTKLKGTYGLVVMFRDLPDVMIAARLGSPLVIGVGKGEHFIASDATPLAGYTDEVIYLSDHEMAVITRDEIEIFHRDEGQQKLSIQTLDQVSVDAELGDYEHYMLKEIFEQPQSLENAMRGRLDEDEATAKFGGLNLSAQQLRKIDRVVLTACGTSWHSGLVGEYLLEEFARIPTEVEYASELRYRNPPISNSTMIFAITQSGETADTLAAMRECKRKGHPTLAICNVVGSTIAREADGGIYLHAGQEVGVASTKAFTSQVMVLIQLALFLGRMRHLSYPAGRRIIDAMHKIPDQVRKCLECNEQVKDIAMKYCNFNNFLYLGRLYNFPGALEGALKLKEISYIHAEGYPAAEMKHGPIALVDEATPSVFIVPRGQIYPKVMSNLEEVKARKGPVIAIACEGDDKIADIADDVIYVPDVDDFLQPLVTAIPLQLLSYHIAVLRGCNVDRPRNLAKSVTVE